VRFLFTTLPGIGHLHPLLPVAAGLRRRGHDVAVAASAPLGPDIAAAGLEHHPVGPPWLTSELPVRFPGIGAIPPGPDRYAYGRATVFAHDAVLDALPDLVALAERWAPDVIVRESAELGGYVAAEQLGIPHAMVRSDSGSASYAERHLMAAGLDDLRRRVGLPPDPGADAAFRFLQLSFAPPLLDDQVLPLTWHQLAPLAGRAEGHPASLDALLSRHHDAIVYATLGTVHNGRDLLAAIVEGVAGLPVELVVTTGNNNDPATLGSLPANVHAERWIPQATLLAHVAAVVTHGGFGTVAAALAHGRPLVLLPISADQPMNAERCAAAGVGIVIGADERTPDVIGATVRTVLGEPRFAAAADRAAAAARALPGLDHGLDLLERLARRPAYGSGRCRTTSSS
jgi:UDP:flavonoid glycosyltransferase YjiC (YdhE family)